MATAPEIQVKAAPSVQIEDTKVLIRELLIDDRDLAEYLAAAEDQVQAIVEAVRLGVRILRLAGTSGDVEMVRREFDAMISGITGKVDRVLADAENELSVRLTKFSTEELRQVLERTDDPQNPFFKLRKDVKDKVDEVVKEVRNLQTEVIKIVSEARGVAVEAEKGTAKGRTYQDVVYEQVDRMASIFGDTARNVADEPGEKGRSKAGDVVVELNPEESSGIQLRIVFEAKNRRVSQDSILEELDEAKENRSAAAAVAVFSRDDYVPGLRTWRDYHGHRYICVLNEEEPHPFALDYSYRCARVDALRSMEAEEVKFDLPAVKGVLKRIRGKIADFQQMQANLTGAKGSLDKVSELIEEHKKAIREDLDEIDRLFLVGQQASAQST